MKFENKEKHSEWLQTNRTHEECSGCKNEYIMPTPCGNGHASGENPCYIRRKMINSDDEL
jgi:hypothetical protein